MSVIFFGNYMDTDLDNSGEHIRRYVWMSQTVQYPVRDSPENTIENRTGN